MGEPAEAEGLGSSPRALVSTYQNPSKLVCEGPILLASVSYPIADLRVFSSADHGRLAKPLWPLPEPGVEFVRQFGAVRRRRRGGTPEFPGEDLYCSAVNAIGVLRATDRSCVYRRLYLSGQAEGKIEVGFRHRFYNPRAEPLSSATWVDIVRGVLQHQCTVAPYHHQLRADATLLTAAASLQRLFVHATSSTAANRAAASAFVSVGAPCLIFEFQCSAHESWRPSVAVELPAAMDGFRIAYALVEYEGAAIPVWFVGQLSKTGKNSSRLMRLYLSRLHAELFVLRRTLRSFLAKELEFNARTESSDRLQRYLNERMEILQRRTFMGVIQSPILKNALQAHDLVRAGEMASLASAIQGARVNILRKVNSFAAFLANASASISGTPPSLVVNMQNFGIQVGDNTTINAPLNSVVRLKDSFNAIQTGVSDENLRGALSGLVGALEVHAQGLPRQIADQVALDVERLVHAATQSLPDKQHCKESKLSILGNLANFTAAAAAIGAAIERVMRALGF